ncbi:MAG TPA: DegT/DnrJ/EryC1/StrS family aminotransferase, partial [Syntrophobacteraceae bacterium]|nr:DegT/DnrJ/EryC1/StrS family aminotransferase [Syntrophobacteraceae bacterium]
MPGFELFGDEERKEVMDVLDTGVLMRYGFDGARKGHWKTRQLEEALQETLRVRYAHVCSSGTAAVCAALAACGVGAGDEVILPPFTFVADPEAVLLAGATPVFADIDDTLCLDPKAVERAITPRTRAVLLVHMCGSMARIDELEGLCKRRGVVLIEDNAQAVGATFDGKALGTFGKAGILSFDYVKTITCGEGGAVITDDPRVYELVDAFCDHGHDHRGNDRGAEGHEHIGTNFRISELNAAVGLAQVRKLDHILQTQRRCQHFFIEGLADLPRVRFRTVPDPDGDSATFLTFFLPSEEEARKAAGELASARVDGCFYWYDNNWHYHRKWDHIKQLRSPGELAVRRAGWSAGLPDLSMPRSDEIMGRTICMQI